MKCIFFYLFFTDLTPGKPVIEGKTKIIYELPKLPGSVLVQSKDRITAGDGVRAHDLVGKAAISTATTCKVFELLNSVGVKTHYIKRASETAFVAKSCEMVPIEWVTRRVATGSFLKRNVGVKEGYRFNPPKQETFFKACPPFYLFFKLSKQQKPHNQYKTHASLCFSNYSRPLT